MWVLGGAWRCPVARPSRPLRQVNPPHQARLARQARRAAATRALVATETGTRNGLPSKRAQEKNTPFGRTPLTPINGF